MTYVGTVLLTSLTLAVYAAPVYGNSQILVYIGICSMIGSLSVMSCKALGVAIKLTFQGHNQLLYPETGYCALVRWLQLPSLPPPPYHCGAKKTGGREAPHTTVLTECGQLWCRWWRRAW